jgi:hypothetical protein
VTSDCGGGNTHRLALWPGPASETNMRGWTCRTEVWGAFEMEWCHCSEARASRQAITLTFSTPLCMAPNYAQVTTRSAILYGISKLSLHCFFDWSGGLMVGRWELSPGLPLQTADQRHTCHGGERFRGYTRVQLG